MKRTSIQMLVLSVVLSMMAGCSDDKKTGSEVAPDTGKPQDPCIENPESCQQKPGDCKENEKKCQDNAVMTCISSKWETTLRCDENQVCNSKTYMCDKNPEPGPSTFVCDSGAIRCTNNISYKCDDNDWGELNKCTGNQTCNPTTGACDAPECMENACNGNVLTKCSASGKKTIINCNNDQTCDKDLGECVDNHLGPVEVAKCTIVDDVTITSGTVICSNDELVTCAEGDLQHESCAPDEICRDGDSACSKLQNCDLDGQPLAHGDKACSDGNIVKCEDGKISISQRCEDKKCMASDGKYVCKTVDPELITCDLRGETIKDGYSACDGNVLRTCNAGTLSEGTDCADGIGGNSLCRAGQCVAAPCGVLASGDNACSEDYSQIVICRDGDLIPETGDKACTADQYCTDVPELSCVDKQNTKDYTAIAQIHADFDDITGLNPKGCSDDGKDYLTIANVAVSGVVTAKKSNGFFIQDPDVENGKNAGIFVNCTNSNCEINEGSIAVGDLVKVTSGYVGYNKCQLWVRTKGVDKIHVDKLAAGHVISPTSVSISDINNGVHNDYNGSLVVVNDTLPIFCDDKKCIVKDADYNTIVVTNYINTKTIGQISNYMVESYIRLNMSGIVYYNSDVSNSSFAPSVITALFCSGTQKKCDDGVIYACSEGQWEIENACVVPDNATAICEANSCAFECNEGYALNGEVCEKLADPKQNCTDVNGQEVAHNKTGCSDAKTRAVCDDGSWGEVKANCPEDPNGVTSCKSNRCSLTCNEGYQYNSETRKCDPILCTSYYTGSTYTVGQKACVSNMLWATCGNDGMWHNEASCDTGVVNGYDECRVDTCVTTTCADGEIYDEFTHECHVRQPSSCVDVNGLVVQDGKNGCSSQTERAVCNDGIWGTVVALCPLDPYGLTSCKSNRCSLKCNDGYKYNSTTKSCDPVTCTSPLADYVYVPGAVGCNTVYSLASCGTDGQWHEETTCVATVDHASAKCENDACTYVCNEGYLDVGGTCEKIVSTDNEPCTDANGAEVQHGKNGCSSQTTRSVCNNGNWDALVAECPQDPHGVTSCKSNRCNLKCNDGYKYDSTTKSCVSLNVCDHNVCASYSSVMVCGSDGQWQGTQVCNSGVAHAEDYCQNDVCVYECEDGYVESDGECVGTGDDCQITDRYGSVLATVRNGEYGCDTYDYEPVLRMCENGVLSEDDMKWCGERGCTIGESVCKPSLVEQCAFEFKTSGSDSRYIAVSVQRPDDGESVRVEVACANEDGLDEALDDWDYRACQESPSQPYTYTCGSIPDCGAGEYTCVIRATVAVSGGASFYCPQYEYRYLDPEHTNNYYSLDELDEEFYDSYEVTSACH